MIDEVVGSPCVRNCCLDHDDTCMGCYRSLDEIKEWTVVDSQRRREILDNAARRREKSYERRGQGTNALVRR